MEDGERRIGMGMPWGREGKGIKMVKKKWVCEWVWKRRKEVQKVERGLELGAFEPWCLAPGDWGLRLGAFGAWTLEL